jgi:hypothetical protein
VRVTHRFHPLFGQDFEFIAHRQNWGEDRVHLHGENGVLFSLPAGWTNVVPADPFAVIADGRCPFTVGGLLALADLIGRPRFLPADGERPLNSPNGLGISMSAGASGVRRSRPSPSGHHGKRGCSSRRLVFLEVTRRTT